MNLGDITQVDETMLKPFNMITGGSPCFPAGTLVWTNRGQIPIEKIMEGECVYTHCHRYCKVTKVGKNEDKKLIRMKAQGCLELLATDNHPIWVKETKESLPQFIPLRECQKGQFIGRPINMCNHDDPNLTMELCWILGRYVADGHIRHAKRQDRKNSYQYGVVLSIGSKKIDDVKRHIKSYHFSAYPHTDSVYRVVIASKSMVELIESLGFGTGAKNKRIPMPIQNLPIDKLKAFLDGYWSGDGCDIEHSGLYSATTISKSLAIDLCNVIQKIYRVGCRLYYTPRPAEHMICGRKVQQHDTYIVRFDKDKSKKHLWFIENDTVWYPIKKVEQLDQTDTVYNITVEQDHTYIANGIAVHNCQDFSVAGKQAGSMWKCTDCGAEYNPLTVHYSVRHKCPKCGSESIDKTRSSLLVEWLRIIRANKPKWGIYENVKNIVGKKFKDTFDMFINELHEYGYNTYYKVLNAKDYGIPQNRERVYLIIILKEYDNGLFEWPEPFDNGLRLKDMLDDEVDESYYVNTERAKQLVDELISSGKLEKSVSNAVRGGGTEA